MQGYAPIPSSTTLKLSLAQLLANDEASISNNSGTAFPTANLFVGMQCYRTDLALMHTLISTNPVTWAPELAAGGVVGVQTTGWAAVGTATLRVVDLGNGGAQGGLHIESYRPSLHLIDRSANERSVKVELNAGTLSFGYDNGAANGAYTSNVYLNPYAGSVTIGGGSSTNVGMYIRSKFPVDTATGTSQYGS